MKTKIIDYKIVNESFLDSLEDAVMELLKDGWQPYGSVVSKKSYFFQPMVKYEPKRGVQIDLT